MRGRIDEIPADRPVVLYCQTGYRSHIAQQILRNRGRDNVRNLLGGYSLLNRVPKLKGKRK
jgi:rhodanese-related sulfurtransferase